MANKKTNTSKTTSSKLTASGPSVTTKLKKKWWFVLLLAILVFSVGSFAYNKYLDYRNVEDMKSLLADFEELEKKIEQETNEELNIEASCKSVGKFASSYACSIYLTNKMKTTMNYNKFTSENLKSNNCRIIDSIDASKLGAYYCVIDVRGSNTQEAENIFYQYDDSPNQP